MYNVSSMYNNSSSIQALREQGYGSADFNVASQPLTYPIWNNTERRESSKSVIYRTDTGSELGVHGHGYQPVPPKTMIDSTRAILERSNLNTDGIKETIRTSHDGARCFVQYTLPAHTYDTPDGDEASLGLLATSSFDGTWPYLISAAAIQSACTNLQVFVSGEVAVFKAKHTKNLDIEGGARVITKALDIFENEKELWNEYINTEYTDKRAFTHIVKALNAKSATSYMAQWSGSTPFEVISALPRPNRNLEYIFDAWLRYKRRLGSNKWALYNAYTDWSTHAEGHSLASKVNIASVQNKRQSVVREAFRKVA